MLETIWNFINTISVYLEICIFVFTTIGGFLIGFFFKKLNSRKLKRILSFSSKGDCEIILPVWTGTLEYSQKEINSYKKNKGTPPAVYEYIQYGETESILHIQHICNLIGLSSDLMLKLPTDPDLKTTNNKFICGGPLSNIYLKHIFSAKDTSPFSFKRRFLFGSSASWMERESNKPFLDIEKQLPPNTRGRIFYVEKDTENEFDEIHIPEGFMIFIKHTQEKRGTHFIAFGNSALTSKKAVKCLFEETDIIYDITKKHKKNFFIIIKCSNSGDADFDKGSIIDLTEKMFGTN